MARQTHGYGEMMDELQTLLAEIQTEELDVDEAIKKYDRGQQLLAELKAYLNAAKNKVEHRTLEPDAAEAS